MSVTSLFDVLDVGESCDSEGALSFLVLSTCETSDETSESEILRESDEARDEDAEEIESVRERFEDSGSLSGHTLE